MAAERSEQDRLGRQLLKLQQQLSTASVAQRVATSEFNQGHACGGWAARFRWQGFVGAAGSSLSSEQQAKDERLVAASEFGATQTTAEREEQEQLQQQQLSVVSGAQSLAASEFEAKLRVVAGRQDSTANAMLVQLSSRSCRSRARRCSRRMRIAHKSSCGSCGQLVDIGV